MTVGQAMPGTWSDMSEYVVHFTKDYGSLKAYDNMLGILGGQCILARNPFGVGRKNAPIPASQNAVCFSEVPFGELARISKARSPLGIGFTKEFALSRGANPIGYLEKGSSFAAAFRELMARGSADPNDPVWKLAPVVDFPGEYGGKPYRFDWEREWRKLGDFGFDTTDVAFLIIPEDLHISAVGFFEDAESDHTGPAYKCPFIDALWTRGQMVKSLRG